MPQGILAKSVGSILNDWEDHGVPVMPAPTVATALVASYTAAQSDTQLVAAPGAAKAIELFYIHLNTDTAMTIELEDGAGNDVIPPQHMAANSYREFNFITPLQMTANKSLTITSATGNHGVLLLYRITSV